MLHKAAIKTKCVGVAIGLVLVPLLAGLLLVYKHSRQLAEEAVASTTRLGNQDVEHIVEGVYALCSAQQRNVDTTLQVAHQVFLRAGNVSFLGETSSWEAVNQFSGQPQQIVLPKMAVGGKWLGKNPDSDTPSPIVDEVQRIAGSACTVFQRMNDRGDMLRVCTTVKDTQGKRSVGTYIPLTQPDGKVNPVVSCVLKGETYKGRAFVVNAWYITSYEPICDQDKQVVGMLFVGVPERSLEAVWDRTRSVQLGENGRVFVMDGSGNHLCHGVQSAGSPTQEIGETDVAVSATQAMCRAARELKPGQVGQYSYSVQSDDRQKESRKLCRFAYLESWDWIIVAEADEAELQMAASRVREISHSSSIALAGMSVLGLGGMILIGYFISRVARSDLESVIASIPDPFMVIDAEHRIVLANQAVYEACGKDPVQNGFHCHQASHHRDTPCESKDDPCPLKEVFATGQPVRTTHVHCSPTGEPRYVDIVASPIFDRSGKVHRVIEACRDVTEQKQAEEKLKESRDYLQNITHLLPGVVYQFRMGPDGSFSMPYASDGLKDIYRVDPEEVRENALRLFAVHHPGDCEAIAASIQKSARDLTPWKHEYRVKFDDGTVRSLYGNALPQREEDGSVIWHGFITDVTDRKRAEEALQAEKTNLDAIFKSSPVGMLVLDETTSIVRANAAAANLALGSSADMLGQRPGDAFRCVRSVEDPRGCGYGAACPNCPLRQGVESVIASGIPLRGVELPVELSREGQVWTVWLRVGAEPIQIDGRQHVILCLSDITSRMEAEEKTRLSEARLRSLFDITQYEARGAQDLLDHTLDEAIKLTSSKIGYIYHYNEERKVFVLNSWSKDVMTACSVMKPQTEYHLEKTGIWGEAVRQRKAIIINDYEAPNPLKRGCPQGHVALHRYLTIPVFDGERIVAVVGVANKETEYVQADALQLTLLMDAVWKITERKRAEERLLESKADLEEVNRQLEQAIGRANEMAVLAETASVAKSEFLANMSHEIRTPLTAILGYSELLMEEGASAEDRKEHSQVILRNGRHLLELVNDVLDISKIEADKLVLEQRPCSIHAIVADVVSLMRVRAFEKRLALTARYVTAVPRTILTDESRLRQALINLVGNAIKFTSNGEVSITVGLVSSGQNGDLPALKIDVCDTGIGLSAEEIGHLFEPFVQADSSTTRKYGGTGLGLTITKRILERMGGQVQVQSTAGVGSVFSAIVPTGSLEGIEMVEQVAEALSEASPLSPQEEQTLPLAGVRILLAEDGPDNQVLICRVLSKAGAEVEVVGNGRLAVEAAMNRTFDVVLMDMQMPEMDGYEAAGRLRAKGYEGPIVALTAHALSGDRERCVEAGCTDFLAKPIDRRAMTDMILKHTSSDRVPVEHREAVAEEEQVDGANVIRSRFAGDTDLAEVIEMFVAKLPQRCREMREALAHNDYVMLGRLAHQMKGAGGGYGYPMLTEVGKELESAAKANDLEGCMLQLHLLATMCEAIERGVTMNSSLRENP